MTTPTATSVPRLTSLSHGAGCACKVRAADLAQVLRALPLMSDPRVIVGLDVPDDAAAVRVSDDLAIVFTTDFFTPIVDDPRTFGRIAACNAISDIYAMGATPLLALNITAFPSRTLPLSVLSEILAGGAEIAREAGIAIAGGHSIDDAEPKYGLAVIGTAHPDKLWRKGGARPGDALILTKPLGTGVISTALKRDRLTEDSAPVRAAIASMTTLNAKAAKAAKECGVDIHAATDVTGFSLTGHLLEMLRQSHGGKLAAVLEASALPTLPEAAALCDEGFIPGGSRANREHFSDAFVPAPDVPSSLAWLACDAQTSGGLLFAVPAAQADTLYEALIEAGLSHTSVIGRCVEGARPQVTLAP